MITVIWEEKTANGYCYEIIAVTSDSSSWRFYPGTAAREMGYARCGSFATTPELVAKVKSILRNALSE